MSQSKSQWLFYTIASGGCAALNGAFAKLTTTQLTTTWAASISRILGLNGASDAVEYAIRASFFLMNLAFNGVMWGLFTKALTLATSTVRVSVINTSANFMVTALLGAIVFGEELPALWWLGAGLLVSGSVIIGSRDEASETNEADHPEMKKVQARAKEANRSAMKSIRELKAAGAQGITSGAETNGTANQTPTRKSPRINR